MFWAFAFFSLLMIPTLLMYDRGSSYEGIPEKAIQYANRTIGNLGYTGVFCNSIPVEIGKVSVACKYGTVGEIYYYGVNPKDDRGICQNIESNSMCNPTNQTTIDYIQSCVGKEECVVDCTKDDLFTGTAPPSQCYDSDANFFVQFTCIASDDELK